MPVSQWISVLRNALAHGCITYLGEDGNSTYGRPAKMFAFVCGKYDYPKGQRRQLVSARSLRIHETDFTDFLKL